MKITTSPASRFVWEGQTVEYLVKAAGATELRLTGEGLPGVQARVTDMCQTDGGVEARIQVEMSDPQFV
jgi:hypothetical protein